MSEKSNKELAVELASAVVKAMAIHNNNSAAVKKPISGEDIDNILKNCYQSVKSLDDM